MPSDRLLLRFLKEWRIVRGFCILLSLTDSYISKYIYIRFAISFKKTGALTTLNDDVKEIFIYLFPFFLLLFLK